MKSGTMKTSFPGLALLFAIATVAHAASFQGLGELPGGSIASYAYAVSADGNVVVGSSSSTSGYQAFRWTAATGMVGLGDLAGGTYYSEAFGVSGDGSVVVGQSGSANGYEAFRWTATNGMVGLGDLPGGSFSSLAWAISANGQVVVGESSSTLSGTRLEAFRWTATNGMVGLGFLPAPTNFSTAYAVSGDGSVIVGYSRSSNATSGGSEAFRWTATNGMVGLGDLAGGITNGVAYGVSYDGRTVVGRGISNTDTHGSSIEQACAWMPDGTLLALGFLPCDTWSTAKAASADGSVIVGDPYQGSGDCAFIWDAQNGIRSLHTVLANLGLNLTGWQLSEARSISADGQTIVGFGTDPTGHPQAWLANITPPSLTVRLSDTNTVFSWPTNTAGFVLEQTQYLPATNGWRAVAASTIQGTNYVITNALTTQQNFFRLRR
jgi:probable HAF family extracellular repeat protein